MTQESEGAERPYIMRIRLQNFMCHENFEIQLVKGLNLIYGTNGSGKSTILTALMVALGSRARATSRSDSLGNFVKSGSSRAWIHITMHIPQAYEAMYRKYGNKVTIIRTIESKGTGRYVLKDANDHNVPKAGANDVKALCYHFGIYPDNELAMLSQENAKEFLVHASDQTKYDKLQRALLNHLIARNRQAVVTAALDHEALLKHLQTREHTLKIAENKAKEVLNRASEQINRKNEIKKVENVLAWRHIDDFANQLNSKQETLAAETELLENFRREATEAQEEDLDSEAMNLTEDIKIAEQKKDSLAREHTALESESKALQYTIKRSAEDAQTIQRDIQRYKDDINVLRAKVADHSPEMLERRRQKLESDRASAIAGKDEATDQRLQKEQYIEGLVKAQERQLKRVNALDNEGKALQESSQALRSELRQLESGNSRNSRKNPLHEKHKQLQRLVANESGWTNVPVGPLYEKMEMTDIGASYSPALERLWTNMLDMWWVQTDADRTKLQRLAQRLSFNNLRIILRRDDKFNFHSAMPPSSEGYYRAIDLMNIDSEPILRILVDVNHIETMVMVQGTKAAFDAVKADKRIRSALAISQSQNGATHFTQVSVTASRTDSSSVRPHDLVRIKVGEKARISQVKTEISNIAQQLANLNEKLERERLEYRRTNEAIEAEKRELKKLDSRERRFEDEIADLSRKIMSIDTDSSGQDHLLDIKRFQDLMQKKMTDYEETQVALDEFKTAYKEAEDNRNAKHGEMVTAVREVSSLRDRLNHIERRRGRLQLERDQRDRRFRQKKRLVDELQSELQSNQVMLDDLTQEAESNNGERLDAASLLEMSTDDLEVCLRRLKSQAQVVNASDEEIEQAQDDLRRVLDAKEKNATSLREIEQYHGWIEKRTRLRQENEHRAWVKIKEHIQETFSRTLRRRKFTGSVQIDDAKKRLVVEASPTVNSERSVSTLSGGEKSFTQVALLMSVWQVMQLGLVAMDEYDVFMDKGNRSMSLRLLADTVSAQGVQCILITPQDVDTRVLEGLEFKMHKLKPAKR